MTPRRTALLSVSDKTGIESLGRKLIDHDWQILSTGGTARALREAGVAVVDVSDHTGFPEIMGGRVKTLHPAVHGGILARRGVDDTVLAEQQFTAIDLVVVNLYPFAATIARPDCTLDEAIEQIDIGGPAMLRAAAKNHAHVCVLCDPADYEDLSRHLPELPDLDHRRSLAVKAFAHTAAYDGQVSQYLSSQTSESVLPPVLNLALDCTQTLRYGENPHQAAGLYRDRDQPASGLAAARPLQGKALSYNNLLDADAAWKGVGQLGDKPGCVIVKHTNPCGAAVADTLIGAYETALACDPTSAFGGIVALNRELDDKLAALLAERFLEVIVAPSVSHDAREILSNKKNVRVITPENSRDHEFEIKAIDGGWLVQEPDRGMALGLELETVTERAPDPAELEDLKFAWAVVAMVRSNAIVYARQRATLGIGAGQMSRVDSARIGALKAADAGLSLDGAVMASDAFFPFADSIEAAAEQGICAVIQPGGSMRDKEVIEACNRHGIAMVLTGRRHFRH